MNPSLRNNLACPKAPVKGNNGNSARRLLWSRLLVVAPIVPIALYFGFRYYENNYVAFYDHDDRSVHVIRNRRNSHKNVIENYLTLIKLSFPDEMALSTRPGINRYGKVQASFCEIDWSKQSENPSVVPMFRDLQQASSKCQQTYTVVGDFHQLVQEAKAFDGFDEETQKANHNGIVFPPHGVVFHETRCGSTLFANLLASFAPGQSRVFSESRPPMNVFHPFPTGSRFDDEGMDEDLHRMLIRDAFYMMGRRPPPKSGEEDPYLFYKIQSVGVLSIDKFTNAFPDVPWVFSFRDTVEIMQSLLRMGRKMSPKVCSRFRVLGRHGQPPSTTQVIKDSGTPFEMLTSIEYCAAHLGGLALSALREYDRRADDGSGSSMGRFVEYTQMPDIVWKDILPNHFGVKSMPEDAIANMEKVSGTYSKGRGDLAEMEWKEDSSEKQESASLTVIQASDLMVSKIYKRMKELSRW